MPSRPIHFVHRICVFTFNSLAPFARCMCGSSPLMSMAFTTFHLFPLLPRELRDIIWDTAIVGPTVRFITIFKDDDKVKPSKEQTVLPPMSRYPSPFGLATPPRCSGMYRDSGLWKACRESRERMQKAYKSNAKTTAEETNRQISSDDGNPPLAKGAGELEFLTRYPTGNSDLFFLKALDQGYMTQWTQAHIFTPVSSQEHGRRLGHVAFEFDPRWRQDLVDGFGVRFNYASHPSEGMLAYVARAAVSDYPAIDHIWFVDHGLRRNPENEPLKIADGAHVFYGHGYNYVEVKLGDAGWLHADGTYHVWRAGTFCMRFIHELGQTLRNNHEESRKRRLYEISSERMHYSDHTTSGGRYPRSNADDMNFTMPRLPVFGVLARVLDP